MANVGRPSRRINIADDDAVAVVSEVMKSRSASHGRTLNLCREPVTCQKKAEGSRCAAQ